MTDYTIKIGDEEIIAKHVGWLGQAGIIVERINHTNGWYDSDRTFGDDIALLHSEVSEALEAFRDWKTEDVSRDECQKASFPTLEAHDRSADLGTHLCKPEGVGSELADVLVRLLDTAKRYGIDLEDEFHRKLQYNATRGYRHGNRNL